MLRPLPPNPRPRVTRRPEILAPAGDPDSLRAALAAGADAVYFGLDDGFNARARARNMDLTALPALVDLVHRSGARAYVTLNTLVFESELEEAERVLRGVAAAGVDALIVQDPAVCLLARALTPELELHASTQMTISSAEGARFAAGLGVTRVVLPRELSVTEIAEVARNTPLETEVFIHGALCMSWSGQCLTSEAWGGRSANRGQCAQSCRMPYTLVVDGEEVPTGELRYFLSPRDLAGHRAVPALMEIGVHTLKIEGRLKGPAYVGTAVRSLARWMDAIEGERADTPEAMDALAQDLTRMSVAYSRGFSDGFLGGSDHQTLVDGRYPRHRGAYLGRVVRVQGHAVEVATEAWPVPEGSGERTSPLPAFGGDGASTAGLPVAPPVPRRGMGIGFDAGNPQDQNEPGGPIFDVEPLPHGYRLTFGTPGPDLGRVSPGHRVWVTGDPQLQREGERLVSAGPMEGRIPLRLEVSGAAGEPLRLVALAEPAGAPGLRAEAASDGPLAPATGRGLDDDMLRSKAGALGGTPFRLAALDTTDLAPGLHMPVSALKALRRALVEQLERQLTEGRRRSLPPEPVLDGLRSAMRDRAAERGSRRANGRAEAPAPGPDCTSPGPEIVPLCRTMPQLEAAIATGCEEVELDFMEFVGLGKAVARAREAGLRVTIATVRVHKPGEEGFDRRIAKLAPDGVLVRHWGALMWFLEHPEAERPVLHGDFSLNVTNALTADHLFAQGLDTLTVSHDLDHAQVHALLASTPAADMTVVLHHHISTFHTEHCVYSHTLSNGRDWRSCGRPCESHRLALRDHLGLEHPVLVDVGCRNTVFNAKAQSAARWYPGFVEAGVRRFRVELVWESREESERVLRAYRALVAGEIEPAEAVRRVAAHEQFGVTSGTMAVAGRETEVAPSARVP
ncbi:MAG: U32 family peptidase [Deltaproteobacteria bacterium]|nr:MAG: U32 family peptidase [Deltaproteobacteria bacterium]